MTKVKILQTTMVAGQRYAKGDVVDIGEDTAQHLVTMGKVEVMPDKQSKNEPANVLAKVKRKE